MKRPIVLGTRGSALALAQVELVSAALREIDSRIRLEVKKITTSGDRGISVTTAEAGAAGLKGLFTSEIEQSLNKGEIDVAVHSCKDLPGILGKGLEIAATLPRASTTDLFIGRAPFYSLPDGATIGTCSVRRRRQLLWLRPTLQIDEMRGNVPTRIQKLAATDSLSGIVLARAGVDRLGIDLSAWHVEELSTLPAVGQGAIALECRSDDKATLEIMVGINHQHTFARVRAERELLRLLNGDCTLPVGVATRLDSGILSMQAILFGADDHPPQTASAFGSEASPEEVAKALFQKLHV